MVYWLNAVIFYKTIQEQSRCDQFQQIIFISYPKRSYLGISPLHKPHPCHMILWKILYHRIYPVTFQSWWQNILSTHIFLILLSPYKTVWIAFFCQSDQCITNAIEQCFLTFQNLLSEWFIFLSNLIPLLTIPILNHTKEREIILSAMLDWSRTTNKLYRVKRINFIV